MPYALGRGDIPGAVVVVVKDGQILTERGFGFANVAKAHAASTRAPRCFRPGSISKLFTWTAVMQQVEQGKLNLDADVNQYLDFKIPALSRQADHAAQHHDAHGGLRGAGQGPHRRPIRSARFRTTQLLKRWVPAARLCAREHAGLLQLWRPRSPATSSSACRASRSTQYVAAAHLRAARHGATRASASRFRPT